MRLSESLDAVEEEVSRRDQLLHKAPHRTTHSKPDGVRRVVSSSEKLHTVRSKRKYGLRVWSPYFGIRIHVAVSNQVGTDHRDDRSRWRTSLHFSADAT